MDHRGNCNYHFCSPLRVHPKCLFIDAFFTIIERIGASTFHILALYVVLYAYFEIGNHRPSFWLAMIAHMISDGLIVVWIVVFSALNNTNPLLYTESIELALIIFDIFFALLVIKYWIPRAETKLKKNEEAEQKPLEPIKKEDVHLDNF